MSNEIPKHNELFTPPNVFVHWESDVDTLLAERDALLSVLIEALAYYANPETYHAIAVLGDAPCGDFQNDFDDTHNHPNYDGDRYGKTARAALRKAIGEVDDE